MLLFLLLLVTVIHGDTSKDSQWLLSIKTKLIDPQGVLDNWSSKVNICSWNGVKCAVSLNQVVGLNLSNSGLSGSISSEFSNLVSLQILDLSLNFLTAESTIGNLSDLRVLGLGYCQLNGSIPVEIGDLMNLKSLNLQKNSLSGYIPQEIGNCKQLQLFSVENNNLQGRIPASIGKIEALEILNLSNNTVWVDPGRAW
ncbi:hypothetical protein C5167_042649 [Papaver somniferum]|uniref:Uncharacterized protein n=1 Tax=Papaver somniferum TaxID=3469 RepID=A0A4Y7L607_PAPSO|nr:hypothetical protein C5167_042649 [Papaver somniferum]